MAYYINDEELIKKISSNGIDIILDWLENNSEDGRPSVKISHDSIILQSKLLGAYAHLGHYTNSVTINRNNKQICINPTIGKNKENITKKLNDFILNIPSIIRDNKINSLL